MQTFQSISSEASANKLASVSRTGHVTFLQTVAYGSSVSPHVDNTVRTPGGLEPEGVVPIRPHCGSDLERKLTTVILDTRQPIRPADAQTGSATPATTNTSDSIHSARSQLHLVKTESSSRTNAHSPSTLAQEQLLSLSTSAAAWTKPIPTPHPAHHSALLVAVPSAPVLDLDKADRYTASSAVAAPTTPQLQHQLDFGLSVAETPKLAANKELFSQSSFQSRVEPASIAELKPEFSTAGLENTCERPSASPHGKPIRSGTIPIVNSSQRSNEAAIHLLVGIHVAIPQDSKAHELMQAYTKTEKLAYHSKDDSNVFEVRQVWEERVDGGEWQVVKEETSLVDAVDRRLT